MKLLLTRPEPHATDSVHRLNALGYEVISEPCQDVKQCEAVLQASDAYIVTSLNGVKYGLVSIADKDAVIFAVGDRTALAAEKLGFYEIYAADGDAESLFEMIMGGWPQDAGRVTHLSGTEIVSDISALLTAIGYEANRQIVYKAEAISQPSQATLTALKNKEIKAALFYSARAVTIFTGWIEKAGLHSCLKFVEAIVLSERIARVIQKQELGIEWKCVKVANEQSEQALFSALSGET